MIRATKIIPLFLYSLLLLVPGGVSAQADVQYDYYWGVGCPHCAIVAEYFEKNDILEKYNVTKHEIYQDEEGRQLFLDEIERLNVPPNQSGVPMMIYGDTVVVGDRPIIDHFEKLEAGLVNNDINQEEPVPTTPPEGTSDTPLIWLVIGGALVDAVNPCAFAVLIILLTTVLAAHNKKRVLLSGLLFSLAIFISYILMGLGIYKAITTVGVTTWFIRTVGVFAILIGLFNLKDFFWYGKGFRMEVPLSWRPTMKKLINSVTNPLTAFLIGLLVSLFLLPCTSGPYIVVLSMLSTESVFGIAFMYLLLYNLIFIIPMVLITIAVFYGFSVAKTEEMRKKNLQNLHLIAGLLMLAMGIWIVITYF